jgi:hypothetical protein
MRRAVLAVLVAVAAALAAAGVCLLNTSLGASPYMVSRSRPPA